MAEWQSILPTDLARRMHRTGTPCQRHRPQRLHRDHTTRGFSLPPSSDNFMQRRLASLPRWVVRYASHRGACYSCHGISDVPDAEGLITKADDPRLNTTACTGAPGCLQAHAQTRELARALAPHVPKGSHLHVSGCSKGCAHPAPATVTLCATPDGFDLIKNGRACDRAHRANLTEEEILLLPHSLFEAS